MSSHDYRGDWWPEAHQIGLYGARVPPQLWERLRAVEHRVYSSLPWVLDVNMDRTGHTSHYAYNNIQRDPFLNSYIHIVTESYMDAPPSEVFITEKTCKAIANLQPLVMFGTAGTLARLQWLGFEPPKSVPTAYDAEPDIGMRLASLYITLAELRSLNMQDLHDRYYAELHALIANRERLFRMPDILGKTLARRLAELG